MIYDTFMVNDELDLLECRIVELADIPDLVHVAIEADVDHQDHRKPFYLSENLDRFDAWADRLRVVRATGLPTFEENWDPWSRERSQREWAAAGMEDADDHDVVLHGDLDEIPSALGARNVRPNGTAVFQQRLYCFAVDLLHPEPWNGTVACLARDVERFGGFAALRDMRNIAPAFPGALTGWHLSWLGGHEATIRKLNSFCHPEIERRTRAGLETDEFVRDGYHVDGKKLLPVEVDDTWPKWIVERKCPKSWFRRELVSSLSSTA